MAEVNVGDITARLRVDASQFDAAMRQAQERLKGLTDEVGKQRPAVDTTTTAWRNMLQVAGGLGLVTTIQGVANAIKTVATEAVTLSARMQELRLSFQAIEGSAQAARARLGDLFDMAQRLGANFLVVADSFRRFDAAAKGTALQGEAATRAYEGMLLGTRALGTSTAQLGRVMTAFEQILSKGKVSQEELRQQLAESIPGAARLMAEGLGVSTRVLESMITTGLLPADAALIALTERLRQIGEQAAAGGGLESMTRVFERLTNETKAWLTVLGDGINTVLRPLLQELTAISEQLRNVFQIRAPGQGAAIPTAMPATTPQAYAAIIAQQAGTRGLDPGLLARLIQAESNFNPQAVSRAGAIGLGQLMPATARELRPGVTEQQLREPETNIALAAEYLSRLMFTFRRNTDQIALALAAYNAGLGTVLSAIDASGQTLNTAQYAQLATRLPGETQRYVARITAPLPVAGAAGQAQRVPGAPIDLTQQAAVTGIMAPGVPEALLKGIRDTLKDIPELQKQFESLRQSSMNRGGLLSETFTKQADQAVDKFRSIASLLAQFQDQMPPLTEEQRTQVDQAGQMVLELQAQVEAETKGAESAQKAIAAFLERDRLEAAFAKETLQDDEERLRIIDALTKALAKEEEQAVKTAQAITARYTQTREERAEDVLAGLMERFPQSERVKAEIDTALEGIRYQNIVNALKDEYTAIQQRTKAIDEAEKEQQAFNLTLETTLQKLRVPRTERTEVSLRARAQAEGLTLTPAQQASLQQITTQERLNEAWRVTESIVTSTAGHMQNAFTTIISGTMRVGAAFKQMAASILQSMRDILINEMFRRLLGLGLNALQGLFLPVTTPYTLAPAGAGPSNVAPFTPFTGMQSGGIVNRPTLALLGEAGPEAVINQRQMASLMNFARASAPSAGGQGMSGVTVINYTDANSARAQQRAAEEEAAGRQVVLNHILSDVGRGESSQLVRALRAMQR